MFGDLPIGIYFDDFIIAGKDEREHDMILREVLKRARHFGVKFNKNKVQYKLDKVGYLGQIFSKEGIKPDPQYIQAILELEEPKNKKELLRILGMLNYLTKYIPNLSNLVSTLRELIKINANFLWTKDHSEIFSKIKNLLTKVPNLKIFDNKLPIEIQCDASQNGVGGCLLQQGQPVAFCSRSMTETEKRYSQIEKEMLTICFSLNKFHHYVYGRKITIKSDHKPLVTICEKDISKVTTRLQRMKLKIMKYNFKVEYLPGKLMYIADLLSRSFIKSKVDEDPEMKEIVHCIDLDLPVTETRLRELKINTDRDKTLNMVKQFCIEGWPDNKNEIINLQVRHYFKLKDSLYVKHDIIFLDDKIVIPESQRKLFIEKLHTGHFGIEKTKARARKICYWPGLSVDIQNFIEKCPTCLKFSRNIQKEPLIQHTRPELPFVKVAADILTYGARDYLVLVDYFSNWIELIPLKFKTAGEIVDKLKIVFSTHGIPTTFVSDNMPFNSYEFRSFANSWEFNLVTSSPRYPRSNGLAEKAVGICKAMLKKCGETNTDIHLALLYYRNTPLAGLNVSPTELLNRRLLRTTLPISKKLLSVEPKINYNLLEKKWEKNKIYYDRQARDRKTFKEGDSIMIKKDRNWVPGEIQKETEFPRSYIVKDEFGTNYRRNSSFIKKSPNPVDFKQPDNDIIPDMTQTNIETPHALNITDNTANVNNPNDLYSPVMYKTRSGRAVVKPLRFRQ